MTDWTDPETFRTVLDRVETLARGWHFEDFGEGETIEHALGMELDREGNRAWMAQTLNHDPGFWRPAAARALGYSRPPIHPDYLLACVTGAGTADLAGKGGYLLRRDDVDLPDDPVYPGTSLRVESTVRGTDPADSRPAYGLVQFRTRGIDAESDRTLVTFDRTDLVRRRQPVQTDGGRDGGADRSPDAGERAGRDGGRPDRSPDGSGTGRGSDPDRATEGDGPRRADGGDPSGPGPLPGAFVSPEGPYFEDIVAAVERVEGRDAAVAYTHERGRTMDDVTAALPLATLNTAARHFNSDSARGVVVAGDVVRSTALGAARVNERTYRERAYDDERFHTPVTVGDTVYGFSRVLECADAVLNPEMGRVEFQQIAYRADGTPVYSGLRTAMIEKRE